MYGTVDTYYEDVDAQNGEKQDPGRVHIKLKVGCGSGGTYGTVPYAFKWKDGSHPTAETLDSDHC